MTNRALAVAALSLAATACPRARITIEPSPTQSRRPPSIEVLGEHIRIVAGKDSAVRFTIEAAEPSVRVIVTFPDTGSIVGACALASGSAAIGEPSEPACRSELPSGVREELVSEG